MAIKLAYSGTQITVDASGFGTNLTTDDDTVQKVAEALDVLNVGGGGTVDFVSNVATASILGRTTAGSGDSEELTATQTRSLLNVEDGATANSSDAALRARSSHTGTQAWSTIVSTPTTLSGYGITDAINVSAIGVTVQSYDADTAKTDVRNTWTASQIPDSDSITFAGTITDDFDVGPNVKSLTLTGDVTAFAVSNGANYQQRWYYVLQDGTGGHTVTFSGIDGTEPTIDDTANALTVFGIEIVPGTGARFI